MKQKQIPNEWFLKKGNKVKVNGEIYKVLKIDMREQCHPTYCEASKTIYLSDDKALEVTMHSVNFQKIEKPNKNTEEFSNLKIKEIKILK